MIIINYSLLYTYTIIYIVIYYHFFPLASNSIKSVNYTENLKTYDLALRINPNDMGVLCNKGNALLIMKKYDEAEKISNKILSIDPNNLNGLYIKGVALENTGDEDNGQTYMDQVHQINPDYTPNLVNKVSSTSLSTIQLRSAI